MPLHAKTKQFLAYLQKNPQVRSQIKAAPDKTLLYAGTFFKPVWKEIADLKRTNTSIADKETLPEVLARITPHVAPYLTLKEYVEAVESSVPWKDDGFVIWRALSGIFASNASGKVSFYVGSGVKSVNTSTSVEERKVFAVTELGVLMRNDKVSPLTKDILSYFSKCISEGQTTMNLAFIAGSD